jgi:hypothetical protein
MSALRERDKNLALYIENVEAEENKIKEIKSHVKESLRFLLLNHQGVVVLLGIGDGTLATGILKKMTKNHRLVIFEPEVGKLKSLLEKKDLSHIVSSKETIILLGEVIDFAFVYYLHEYMVNGGCYLVKNKLAIESASEKAKENYDVFAKKFAEEKKFWDVNIGTQLNIGKNFINSILQNVPHILDARSTEVLREKLKDYPAIIVSTGPSLDDSLEDLRKAQGKAVIISIDTSWPILKESGIIPDLVVGIDPLSDNEALFKDLPDCPFVCMSQYTPTVLERMLNHGTTVYVSGQVSNPVYGWLHYFWEDKGAVDCFGGSVAHYGLSIAEFLGCNPIALIGQDLSFTSKIHAGDITKRLHDHGGVEVPDEVTGAIMMKNIKGDDVCTKQTFLSFKSAFEQKIRNSKNLRIINCTPCGLRIDGSEEMDFSEFVSQCKGDGIKDVLASLEYQTNYNLRALVERMEEGIKIFTRIKRAASVILRGVNRMRGYRIQKNNKKVKEIARKIEMVRPRTQHALLSLIAAYYYHLELYLRRTDIKQIDDIKNKWKRVDLQIDRGLNFYGELIEAIDVFLEVLIPVKDKLKERERNENAIECELAEASGE